MEVQTHSFLILALHRGEMLSLNIDHFTQSEEPRGPLTRGWVGPREGLNSLEENLLLLPGFEPLAVQLNRLRYPGYTVSTLYTYDLCGRSVCLYPSVSVGSYI